MSNSASDILVAFTLREISFWDVMAWANQVDSCDAACESALSELKYIDEDTAEPRQIEKELLKLIPLSDEETLSELLLREYLERLDNKTVTSKEFVNFIIDSVQKYEDEQADSICADVYEIFNLYNGYGLEDLAEMTEDQLFLEIDKVLKNS